VTPDTGAVEPQPKTEPSLAQSAFIVTGLVLASVGAALFFALDGRAAGTTWEVTISGLLIVMLAGILCFRREHRLGWIALWVGLLSAHVGGLLAAHPTIIGVDPTAPSVIDVLRLANYPLGAFGVMVLLFGSGRKIGWRASLDAVIAVTAGVMVIWLAVLEPLLAAPSTAWLDRVVGVMYPTMDMLLLGVLMVLLMHLEMRAVPLVLVAVALAGNLAADVAFGAQSLDGTYAPGGVVDGGWLLCFAALAVAPSWPSVTDVRLVGDDGRLGGLRLSFLGGSAVVVPVMITFSAARGERVDGVLAVGGLCLVSLAIVRMAVFNRDLNISRHEMAKGAAALSAANDEIHAAHSDRRRLLDRVHRLIEQERVHLAAEIHDRPLQNLAGVGYQLERLRMTASRGDLSTTTKLADEIADALATQLGELRSLMTEIRPPVLDEQGLLGALRDNAREVMAAQPGLTVTVDGECPRLDCDVETVLYRVAQEAMQNVVRHADADEVFIELVGDEDRSVLRIQDNGGGFETDRVDEFVRSGHFGVAGMRERVELLGGIMRITSSSSGTTLEFDVPTAGAVDEFAQIELETVR